MAGAGWAGVVGAADVGGETGAEVRPAPAAAEAQAGRAYPACLAFPHAQAALAYRADLADPASRAARLAQVARAFRLAQAVQAFPAFRACRAYQASRAFQLDRLTGSLPHPSKDASSAI